MAIAHKKGNSFAARRAAEPCHILMRSREAKPALGFVELSILRSKSRRRPSNSTKESKIEAERTLINDLAVAKLETASSIVSTAFTEPLQAPAARRTL